MVAGPADRALSGLGLGSGELGRGEAGGDGERIGRHPGRGARGHPVLAGRVRGLGPAGRGGAIVSNVSRSSPANNAGVQPNDVILEVNRTPVTNVSQVTRELQNAATGSTVLLVVWRVGPSGGQEVLLTLRKR